MKFSGAKGLEKKIRVFQTISISQYNGQRSHYIVSEAKYELSA